MRKRSSTNYPYFLGIDIGGTQTKFDVIDKNTGRFLLDRPKIPTDSFQNSSELKHEIDEHLENIGLSYDQIQATGVGCPGIIERSSRRVKKASNVPEFEFDLEEWDLLALANDANLAALGEYVGREEKQDLVYINIGTGIGAGTVLRGHLRAGAGEAGFLTISHNYDKEVDSRIELLGVQRAWEGYCSGANLSSYINMLLENENRETELKPGIDSSEALFQMAEKGDEVAQDYEDNIIEKCAEGVGNINSLNSMGAAILGGAVIEQNSHLLGRIEQKIGNYTVNDVPSPELSSVEHPGIKGAIELAYSMESEEPVYIDDLSDPFDLRTWPGIRS